MSAAYPSGRGASDDPSQDLDARLAGLEAQVADLRELLGGAAARSLDDRVTAIERLLVRLEAGLSVAPRGAATEVDLSGIEGRVAGIESTLVGAFDRFADQLQATVAGSRTPDVGDAVARLEAVVGELRTDALDHDDLARVVDLLREAQATALGRDDLDALAAVIRDTQARAVDREDLEGLIAMIERVREDVAHVAESRPDPRPELASLVSRLDELSERIGQVPDVDAIEGVAVRIASELEAWRPSDAVADDLVARLSSRDRFDELQDRVTGAVDRLRERVTSSLEAQPDLRADLAALAEQVESLTQRLGRVPDADDLAAMGDRVLARLDAWDPAAVAADLNERLAGLARADDLASLAEGLRRLPDGGAISALETRLESVATAEAFANLMERVDRIEPSAALTSLGDRVDELGDRIARRDDLTALRKQVSDLARAEDLAVLVDRLERPLAVDGLQGVEDRLDRVLAEMRAQNDDDVVVQLERLRDIAGRLARAEDVEALIELVAGIDGRTQHVATSRDVASVRDQVSDLERGLGQLDVSEAVLAFREELDRVTKTLHEARRDVAQLAAGDISDLRDRVAGLASSVEVDAVREELATLGEAVAAMSSATSRIAGADAALTTIRERVESLEVTLESRTQQVLEPLDDLHDLVASRTDALLQPGRIQAALAPIWEGIATIAEDLGNARDAATKQQDVVGELGDVVGSIERLAGDLAGRVKGEEDAIKKVVREGVASELDEVLSEVRKLGASYHRVATDLGEQVQRLRQTSDEVVGSLQRRDRMLQDEVVERLVTALDQVVDLGGRSRRKVAKALAEAAADGIAKAGDWEQPEITAGPTRVTLRREEDDAPEAE